MSPNRRIDLALPGAVTLGELLPSILRFSGYEGGTPQEVVHGWVLQRFGEDPLDPNQVIGKLAIRDGETLYLRPRDNAMPDAAFDDVVDAVSFATSKRPSWRPQTSKKFAIAALGLILTGLPFLLLMLHLMATKVGERGYWGAIICLVLAAAAAIAAIAISRAAGEHAVSSTLAWSAVTLAGLGGWQVLDTADLPSKLVMSSALVLAMATTCALSAGVMTMQLFSVAISAALVLGVAIVSALVPNSLVGSSAVGLVLVLAVTAMLPSLSYKLAQIQLPNLPSTAEALLADEEPVQSDIVQRAVLADRLLTALLTAAGITMTLCAIVQVSSTGLWAVLLTLAVGLALLMRARAFVGLSQRLVMLIPGVLITFMGALAGLQLLGDDDPLRLVLVVGVGVLAAVFLAWYATARYDKIVPPGYGRLADVTEWLSVMAVVPLLLGVLNTYSWVQSLFTGG